jgi:hypothetical protein
MEHQNGHERAGWASLQEQISSYNQMGLCVVLPITRSTRKNVVKNMMAPYASYTQPASVIAGRAHYENSV